MDSGPVEWKITTWLGILLQLPTDQAMLIGYLIPEFPGQTHIFFWRERMALRKIGVDTDLLSTRRPAPQLVSHDWAHEAMRQTLYLRENLVGSAFGALRQVFRAGPSAWVNCVSVLRANEGINSKLRLVAMIFFGAKLASLARRRGWRHVHVHSCADSANIALFASLLAGPSYSLTLHGPLRDYGGNQRQKWKNACFGIVITRTILTELRATIGSDLPRIHVCPMGVDLSVFRRAQPYLPYIAGAPLRIFSCGRLNPCKGYPDLIEAVAIIRAGGIDAQLEIAGEDEFGGRYRSELTALIKKKKLDGLVTLLGAISESEIRSRLEGCHIFALLSIAEPLGVAIMEAMAMEAPVVATDAGGVPELITDMEDGILTPSQDARAAAEKIRLLALDSERAQRIGIAARRKIAGSFESMRSAEVIANELASYTSPPTSK